MPTPSPHKEPSSILRAGFLPVHREMTFDEYRTAFPKDFKVAVGHVLNRLRRYGIFSGSSFSLSKEPPASARRWMIDGDDLWTEIAKYLVRERLARIVRDTSPDFIISC